jgi:hypothetical protein
MALIHVNWNPGHRELRQFSLAWIAFFGLVGAYCWWAKDAAPAAVVLWLVAIAGVAGLFRPPWIRPVYVVLTALALPIGWIVSHLVLLVIYYLVLTPIGLLMRLVGYDPLQCELDRSAKSYWTEHEPADDPARYFKQY